MIFWYWRAHENTSRMSCPLRTNRSHLQTMSTSYRDRRSGSVIHGPSSGRSNGLYLIAETSISAGYAMTAAPTSDALASMCDRCRIGEVVSSDVLELRIGPIACMLGSLPAPLHVDSVSNLKGSHAVNTPL